MSKKIELRVQIFCDRCKATIWKTAAKVHGVNSLSLDEDKGVLTVIGTADAVEIAEKLRKAKICAEIASLGPEKTEEKKEEKKEEEKKDKDDDEKKKIECNCKSPCNCGCTPYYYAYGQQYAYNCYPAYPACPAPVVCYEQYPNNNCVIC